MSSSLAALRANLSSGFTNQLDVDSRSSRVRSCSPSFYSQQSVRAALTRSVDCSNFSRYLLSREALQRRLSVVAPLLLWLSPSSSSSSSPPLFSIISLFPLKIMFTWNRGFWLLNALLEIAVEFTPLYLTKGAMGGEQETSQTRSPRPEPRSRRASKPQVGTTLELQQSRSSDETTSWRDTRPFYDEPPIAVVFCSHSVRIQPFGWPDLSPALRLRSLAARSPGRCVD